MGKSLQYGRCRLCWTAGLSPLLGFTAPEPGALGFQQEMWVAGLYGWRFISGGLPSLLVGQVNE